jgi:bifunctional oligoribonuclease and PAP phosphatase NrnA
MEKFSQLKNIINSHNSFLLTTHVNPDADAIGSELAFYFILKKLGKKVRIVNHSATPYNLKFMDEDNVIEKIDEQIHKTIFEDAEVCIILDLNNASRIVKMENGLRSFKGIKICIDHHQDPENIFDYIFGGTSYSATGEVIYSFVKETKIVELDHHIAFQLYTAILTDTGSFRFERTTPAVHRLIAELLELGVNPTKVYDQVYDQFMFGRIKLLGNALSSIELDETKQIAHMVIGNEMLERNGATEADVDGFVNYCLSIQGVKIGILFYELKDGIKISFRSKGNITVNKLANEYGGGGHINASGARLGSVTIDEMKEKVINSAKKYLSGE